MAREGLPSLVIDTFEHYYGQLARKDTGYIRERDIEPVARADLSSRDELSGYREDGLRVLGQTAILKLNGGLGTTMGLEGPKCLLRICGKRNFLDLIHGRQACLRAETGHTVPVLYMNSFNTEEQTREYLTQIGASSAPLPLSFVQHKYPKVLRDTLEPASWPPNPRLEWNPPGHGNVYTALVTSGILRQMLDLGIRYVFASNVDNLGASLDLCLLGYLASQRISFMMEVVERTEMDRKGGHLARHHGRLVLRELAQCAPEEREAFQDVERYCYFNTNNIWINLERLDDILKRRKGVLDLPLIKNEKYLDPRDAASPPVYQIETAMGAAIGMFDDARAVKAPRIRFSAVKRCEELLVAWSDYYVLSENFEFGFNPARTVGPIRVELDPAYYGTFDQMQQRFPCGAPSLAQCATLRIEGDVRFGHNVVLRGNVRIVGRSARQAVVADNAVVEGDLFFG
jgi:UTP--glucose-1-phosphate uridylyltransferase